MNNGKIIEFLLDHNKSQSEIYCSPDATLAREQYRAAHPTEIAALKCMDGRLNLPLITKTPWGIIQPFRNVGGRFDLGWPYFGQLIQDWVEYSVTRARDCLLFITYHWSKSSEKRGCKGFDYDREKACQHTADLKEQAERIFGHTHTVVYPIQVGVETDEDALVLHGENGETLNLATFPHPTRENLSIAVEKLFPDMKKRMLNDLLPILIGNIEHVAEIRKAKRPIREVEHGENTIALGRGFSWLHIPNKALIVGPFSYDLGQPIITAAHIVIHNLTQGRIPKEEGAVLMVSALCRHSVGPERLAAVEKAESLTRFGLETIQKHVPELIPHLQAIAGTVDANTMLFTPNSTFKTTNQRLKIVAALKKSEKKDHQYSSKRNK